MPNIEIHGFYAQPSDFARRDLEKLVPKIKTIFADWNCAGDMITDVVFSAATDRQNHMQPYLRVWDTNEEEGGENRIEAAARRL